MTFEQYERDEWKRHAKSVRQLPRDRAQARTGSFHVEVVSTGDAHTWASHVVVMHNGSLESFRISDAFRAQAALRVT